MTGSTDGIEIMPLEFDLDNPEDRETLRRVDLLAEILQVEDRGDALRIMLVAKGRDAAAIQLGINLWSEYSKYLSEDGSYRDEFRSILEQVTSLTRRVAKRYMLNEISSSSSVN